MIVEQELEKRVLDVFKTKLDELGINNIQLTGSLQTTEGNERKSEENPESVGFLMVKAKPRQYSTPTIPECQISISVALTIRSDMDFNGKTYIDVFETLLNTFERWQKCLDDVHELFTIQDKFNVTGYQLNSGDTPLDKNSKVWGYVHEMTLYGVIL